MYYLYTSYELKDLEKLYLSNEDLNIQLIEKSNYNNLLRMIILIKSDPYHKNDITKKINSYRVSRKIEETYIPEPRMVLFYLNAAILRQLCYVLKDDTSFVFNYEPQIYGLYKLDNNKVFVLRSLNDIAFNEISNYEEISTYKLTKDYFQNYFNEFIQKTYNVDKQNFVKFDEVVNRTEKFKVLLPHELFSNIDYYKDYTLKTARYIYDNINQNKRF